MTATTQLWLDRRATGAPRAERYVPVRNAFRSFGKPAAGSGLWTSTYRASGSWLDYVRGEYAGWLSCVRAAWLLHPAPDARVWEIASYADLDRLMVEYPEAGDALFPGTRIDFERMARDGWAGIHLTEGGQWATRVSAPHSLYGWDCESTLWLRWCFTHVGHLGLTALDLPPIEVE